MGNSVTAPTPQLCNTGTRVRTALTAAEQPGNTAKQTGCRKMITNVAFVRLFGIGRCQGSCRMS